MRFKIKHAGGFVFRSCQRKPCCYISDTEDLFQFGLCQVLNSSETCKIPGIYIVIDRYLGSQIKNKVTRFCCDRFIISRESGPDGAHFFKIPIIMHLNSQISCLQQFREGFR